MPFFRIAAWLHQRAPGMRPVAVLEAYFDESMTQGVTAIAGYVATDTDWASIEGLWAGVLGLYADKGVRTFHATDCCGVEGYGEFGLVDTFHRMNILNSLSGILMGSAVQPVWSAVYTEDWDAAVTDPAFLAAFPKPFHLCFEHIARQLAHWGASRIGAGERIPVMFACQAGYQEWMAQASQSWAQPGWHKDVLGALAFDRPQRVIPLQCADLLAHEISWEWERREYGPRPTIATGGYRRLLERASAFNGLHVGGCFGVEGLCAAVERFKRTGSII